MCEVQLLCLLISVCISTVSHCVVLGGTSLRFSFSLLLSDDVMCSLAAYQPSQCSSSLLSLFRLDNTVELLTVLFCPRRRPLPRSVPQAHAPLGCTTLTVWAFHSSTLSQSELEFYFSCVVVVHSFIPSTPGAETSRSLSSRPASSTERQDSQDSTEKQNKMAYFLWWLFKRFLHPSLLRSPMFLLFIQLIL